MIQITKQIGGFTFRNLIMTSFEISQAYLQDYRLSREDWYKNQMTRYFIFDELVRNIVYGLKGDIETVSNINDELKELILAFIEMNQRHSPLANPSA